MLWVKNINISHPQKKEVEAEEEKDGVSFKSCFFNLEHLLHSVSFVLVAISVICIFGVLLEKKKSLKGP